MDKTNNSVKFEALIKQLTVKSLVSLDKGAELKLQFNAEDDDLISKINKLHKADATVKVVIKK